MNPPSDLVAPKGKYRVVGIDKFEPPGEGHWVIGDYDDLQAALAFAREKTRDHMSLSTSAEIATVFYVYDDQGCYLGGDIYAGE